MIESYSFGRIVVDGKRYTTDVIIYPDHVKDGWWRKEGHRLHIEDLKDVIEAKPDVLVVGTGYFGLMKVPTEVKQRLKEKEIEVVVQPTKKACETFNQLIQSGEKVVAAFHLTC
ncbi:MAG: Mth938-like domain-containing protein [Thermoproteota archaeon]|nr:Mth938-like domain-containing protein [Thermoproteota archaeon]